MAGNSYAIYNEDAAVPFDNKEVRARFEAKCKADFRAIYKRIEQVTIERAYRIVGMLEQTAQMLKQDVVTRLQRFNDAWRRQVLWLEGAILAIILVTFLGLTIWGGLWDGWSLSLPFLEILTRNNYVLYGVLFALLAIVGFAHFRIRRWAANKIAAKLIAEIKDADLHPNYQRAFAKTSRWWRSLLWPYPAGWSKNTAASLEEVVDESNAYIQKLNDEYTNPSGKDHATTTFGKQVPTQWNHSDLPQNESGIRLHDNSNAVTSKN